MWIESNFAPYFLYTNHNAYHSLLHFDCHTVLPDDYDCETTDDVVAFHSIDCIHKHCCNYYYCSLFSSFPLCNDIHGYAVANDDIPCHCSRRYNIPLYLMMIWLMCVMAMVMAAVVVVDVWRMISYDYIPCLSHFLWMITPGYADPLTYYHFVSNSLWSHLIDP